MYAPYIPREDFYEVAHMLPSSCDDPLLDDQPLNRQRCKACASRPTRTACLSSLAETWNFGAGEDVPCESLYQPARLVALPVDRCHGACSAGAILLPPLPPPSRSGVLHLG